MIHVITLSLFLILIVHDAFPGADSPFPLVQGLSSTSTALLAICPFFAFWAATHLVVRRSGRALDRTGRHRPLRTAILALTIARVSTLLLFAIAVLGADWLGVIRNAIGDVVLLDEALALLLPLATLALLWWSYYPIERRLREAAILTSLDRDHPVPGLPTRWQYVADQVRLHLLLVIVPLFALTLWWESFDRVMHWADSRTMLPERAWVSPIITAAHYAGILAIVALMPLLLVRVWSTVRLGHGPLRERLESLCRNNAVRVRDLLVWRTHNAMVNGALVGVVPPFRYILLTDALLASLPLSHIEAVMAHEVGHVLGERHAP